jgi:hypothetical protein
MADGRLYMKQDGKARTNAADFQAGTSERSEC